VRSKAYKVILPASYTEDELHLIEGWSFDNCYRAAVLRTDDNPMWVCIREKTRSKCEWLRSLRGVFNALRLRPLAGDGWLALCVEPEALEIIRAASNGRNAQQVDTTQEDNTREILMPSARRRAASSRAGTKFEIVRT
jgi:hypothetical protein